MFLLQFSPQCNRFLILQVLKSKDLQERKQGENISFDPSSIPPKHGEIPNIGDVLLKDAKTTHRSNYLKYLREHVLPADTPAFDLKIRHKDPTGKQIPILNVRCGKQVATQVAQTLSTCLNGEGTNPEIFISRFALGTNRVARGDHQRIYHGYRIPSVFGY
jgi:hypothetical protein